MSFNEFNRSLDVNFLVNFGILSCDIHIIYNTGNILTLTYNLYFRSSYY